MLQAGVRVSRGWLTQVTSQAIGLLEPIYEAQLASIRTSRVKAMDETPIKAGRAGPGKLKSCYFWPVYGEHDEVCFPFFETRAHATVEAILGLEPVPGGVLVSDGYKAYAAYAEKTGIKHAQCWAHCRREFFNAQSAEPVLANEALDRIGKLYKIEEEIRARKLDRTWCPADRDCAELDRHMPAARHQRLRLSGRCAAANRSPSCGFGGVTHPASAEAAPRSSAPTLACRIAGCLARTPLRERLRYSGMIASRILRSNVGRRRVKIRVNPGRNSTGSREFAYLPQNVGDATFNHCSFVTDFSVRKMQRQRREGAEAKKARPPLRLTPLRGARAY